MKTNCCILRSVLLTIVLTIVSNAAYAQSGLVGWWKFDEATGTTAADSSGSGNTGTLSGAATRVAGRINGGVSFPSSPAIIDVADSGNLSNLYLNGLTVAAWIIPGGTAGRIADKNNSVSGGTGWHFGHNSATTVHFSAAQFATSSASRTSGATLTPAAWNHVVATWDGTANGSGIHIYINGVLSNGASTNGSGAAESDALTPLSIGNRPVDMNRRFGGAIDEVRIFSRVLTLSEIQALADSTAPSAPSALTAAPVSSTQIDLSWTASTDNVAVTGYRVERCQGSSCSNFAEIGTPTGTTFNDAGLTASTTYRFRVRATDANANLSTYSSIVNATTTSGGGDTQAPSIPTLQSATPVSSSQINLSWTASTDNVAVTGYRVERCQGSSCSNFAEVGTPTGTTFNNNSGLVASTTYRYRVRAHDAVPNFSNYSNILNATTQAPGDTQAPTAPSGLMVVASSSSEIDLIWTGSTDNVAVTAYLVERCQGAGCSNFSQIGSPAATKFDDTGRAASMTYRYRVRAQDAVPNFSTYSNVIDIATPASSPDCN